MKENVLPVVIKDTEPAHWQATSPGQRSYLVEVLHWFHYRPKALARSWTKEEVLTWELLRSLELLPQSMFLRPLLLKIAGLSSDFEPALAPLLNAPYISVFRYPSLQMNGSKWNCRSDIGFGLGEAPTVWLEAKTAPFKAQDLCTQIGQQRVAMAGIFQSTPTALVTLLPAYQAVSGVPNLSWNEVSLIFETGVTKLREGVGDDDIRRGYESLAKELIQRILTHPNHLVRKQEGAD
jgi:hypothetical protein